MGVVGGCPRCEFGSVGRRLRAMTRLRLTLVVTATAGSIALFFVVAHPGRLVASLGALPASAVASAVAATMAGVMLVAFRWRLLLGARSIDASIARLFAALTMGAAVNNVVPARAGDAVRVESAHRLTGASRLAIAGSLLSERIFDAFVLAVLVLIGALSTGSTGGFLWLRLRPRPAGRFSLARHRPRRRHRPRGRRRVALRFARRSARRGGDARHDVRDLV